VLDADGEPSFNINKTDINNPIISFSLPRSQVLQDPVTIAVNPLDNPSIRNIGTVN
jgi:hypothetical protein